jgi:hypothetical protein
MKATKSVQKKPVDAKPEHYFILVTGIPLKNLKDLANTLETMNEWTFNHHVNDSRNDFSSWIKEILKEDDLSEEIKQIRNIKDMEIKILKHLVTKYI